MRGGTQGRSKGDLGEAQGELSRGVPVSVSRHPHLLHCLPLPRPPGSFSIRVTPVLGEALWGSRIEALEGSRLHVLTLLQHLFGCDQMV